MAANESALRALLGVSEFAWLRARLRAQALRGKTLEGTLRHPGATEAEREAWARLSGRRSTGVLTVRLDDLEQLLVDAGLATDLLGAVEALEGPLSDQSGLRNALEAAWEEVLASDDPAEADWLAALRAGGLLRRLAGDPTAGHRLMAEARGVRARLPARGLLLTELAALACGDAHALDRGTPLATVVLRGFEPSAPDLATGGGADWRAAWERLGVACDALSAPLLVLNLRPDPDCPLGPALAAFAKLGTAYRVSLQQLAQGLARFTGDRRGTRVFVCENPSVVAVAADRLGPASAPLVCLEGQPKGAAHRLLGQLAEAGAELAYHGDFDWAGIAIGNLVMRRYGAVPWRFGATDYSRAGSGKELSGSCVNAIWDCQLAIAMLQAGRAVHEEAVLEGLLTDLSRVDDCTRDVESSAWVVTGEGPPGDRVEWDREVVPLPLKIQVDPERLAEFCAKWQISELSLFGSVLRDDFTADSDIDVLVTWLPGARVSLFSMADMTAELENLFGRPVDLVPKEGLKPRIRHEVLQGARLLYAAA